jgi:sugar transferase EpsL
VLKRTFDLVLAATVLVVASPLMGFISLAVLVAMGPPVLFRQRRPGLDGRIFTLLKFRTMLGEDHAGARPDGDRITRLGRLLRATSFDELPELVNVLRGDMSLVGPRPLLERYMPYFSETERKRHTVRPGVTGWAQVTGRNTSTWDARLAADVWYVENRSFLLDMKILLLTVFAVVARRGVVVNPEATMANLDQERRARISLKP